MGFERLGFEFRVELTPEEPRMVFDLDHFHQVVIRIFPRDHQSCLCENLLISRIELVAVAMPFIYVALLVCFFGKCPLF